MLNYQRVNQTQKPSLGVFWSLLTSTCQDCQDLGLDPGTQGTSGWNQGTLIWQCCSFFFCDPQSDSIQRWLILFWAMADMADCWHFLHVAWLLASRRSIPGSHAPHNASLYFFGGKPWQNSGLPLRFLRNSSQWSNPLDLPQEPLPLVISVDLSRPFLIFSPCEPHQHHRIQGKNGTGTVWVQWSSCAPSLKSPSLGCQIHLFHADWSIPGPQVLHSTVMEATNSFGGGLSTAWTRCAGSLRWNRTAVHPKRVELPIHQSSRTDEPC